MLEEQYQKGVEQFSKMVGADRINKLREKFSELSPDFERIGWKRRNRELSLRIRKKRSTENKAPNPSSFLCASRLSAPCYKFLLNEVKCKT